MSFKRIVVSFFLLLSFFSSIALAGGAKHTQPTQSHITAPSPWFTGPLLAGSGATIPKGHTNYEPYLFYTDSFGYFNNTGNKVTSLDSHTLSPTMIISHGLSRSVDVQASIPFDSNSRGGESDSHFGDIGLVLGYQLMRQHPGSLKPDARVFIEQSFPTGEYENLNPMKNGTDSTGAGAYQTTVGVNFQRLWHVSQDHFLRGRLTFGFNLPTTVHVTGFNSYGGAASTDGEVRVGNGFSTDLSFEYTLTQHWVPAIDFLYTHHKRSTFNGNVGVTASGLPATIALAQTNEFSIAPAIEYNFTSKFGIIVGGWFAFAGQNSSDFDAAVFALNYYD